MAVRAEVLALDIDVESKQGIEGVKGVRAEVEKLARARGFEIRQGRQRKAARETNEALAAQRRELAQLRRTQNVAASAASRSSRSFGAAFGAIGRGAAAAGPAGIAIAGVGEGLRLAGAAADVAAQSIELQARALVSATNSALDFQDAIVRVSAITGGGARDFDILREAAARAGASTLFSAQEAAGGLRFLAQAGLDARESAAALPRVLELASAGALGLEDAANISTNALATFGLGIEDLSRINDVLANTAASSNTNVQEIGVALRLAGSAARGAGLSFEETTAFLGAFAGAGLSASQRGRALRNVTNALLAPTARASELYKRYNIELTDAAGNTVTAANFVRQLANANISAGEIAQSFSVQQAAAIRTARDQIAVTEELLTSNLGAAGRAAEISGEILGSYRSRVTILESTIASLSTEIGSRFTPAVGSVADILTEQLAAILQNEEALENFDVIARESAQTFAEVLRVSSQVVPVLIQLGGSALELARIGSTLFEVWKRIPPVFIALRAIELQGFFRETSASILRSTGIIDGFGESVDAASNVGETAGSALRNAADGVDEYARRLRGAEPAVNDLNASIIRMAAGFALNEESRRALDLYALRDGFAAVSENIEAAYQSALRFASVGVEIAFDESSTRRQEFIEELGFRRQAATVAADLKQETLQQFALLTASNDVERARLQTNIAIAKLKSEQSQGENLDLAILNEELKLEQQIANIRRRRRARRQQTTQRNAQALARTAQLEAQRLDLLARTGGVAERIAALQADSAARLAQLDAQNAGKKLTDQEQINDTLARENEQRRVLLEIDEVRTEELDRQAALQAKAVRDAEEEARRRARLADQRQSALERSRELEADLFRLNNDQSVLSNRLASIDLERRNALASLNAQLALTGEQRLTAQQRLNVETQKALVQREAEARVARELNDEAERALARQVEFSRALGGAGQGLTGFGALALSEAGDQRALDAQIAALTAQQQRLAEARQAAAAGGADTQLLEAQEAALARRAEGLRAEFELERQNQQLLRERLGLYAEAATQAGELGAQIAILGDSNTSLTESYNAQAAAISATVGIASALAAAGIEGTKQQAIVQALFNGAASVATFAAYASSGFVAGNLLTASINHGLAAAKFGLVAGTSGGVSTPRTAGGGRTQANPRPTGVDTARINQRGRDSRSSLGGGGVTYNYDLSRATFLESAPATQRRLLRLGERAQGSSIQLGGTG